MKILSTLNLYKDKELAFSANLFDTFILSTPVNKSLDKFINKRKNHPKNKNNTTNAHEKHTKKVSVITCTNRPENFKNIFDNYVRQNYKRKELIIILNNNKMILDEWIQKGKAYKNVNIYQLDENKTLGACLNFAVSKSSGAYIAKFDDDDYYGRKYLKDSIKAFQYTKADVIGKSTTYVYFEKEKILALRHPYSENHYVSHIDGPTLIIKRKVFKKVKFRDVTRGEDKRFCKDCMTHGIKLYSTNRYHHVYIRHSSSKDHTWRIKNKELLKKYKTLKKNVSHFEKYVNK